MRRHLALDDFRDRDDGRRAGRGPAISALSGLHAVWAAARLTATAALRRWPAVRGIGFRPRSPVRRQPCFNAKPNCSRVSRERDAALTRSRLCDFGDRDDAAAGRRGTDLCSGLSGLHARVRAITYYDCRYTSLAQCSGSASGRPAQCVRQSDTSTSDREEPAVGTTVGIAAPTETLSPARRPGRPPATPGGPCGRPVPCCGSRSASPPASP